MDAFALHEGAAAAFRLIDATNEFIAHAAPWQLAKDASASDRLTLRYEYESGLRALGIFPDRGRRLWEREHGQMGFAQPPRW